MRIYDVSVPISEDTPTYAGDPGIEISSWATIAGGDAANVSLLHLGAHTGTHVDAPAHFLEGAGRVEALPLDVLVGLARVVEIPEDALVIKADNISVDELNGATRVLFKTRNSRFWADTANGFRTDYTYIAPDAARLLVENGVRLVGIDYLSVEAFKPERFDTHEVLLSSGAVIIEGLDLREIVAGVYELICLPLKIAGRLGDGAPARAILRTLD
jgi:arylformamidase